MVQSGAAGLLVGRGAMGRPWLIGKIADHISGQAVRKDPTHEQKIDTMRAHTDAVLTLAGTTGLRGSQAFCRLL